MEFPQHIELWYLMPAIRRELSKELKRKGLSQRKIAEALGVTDAAVSQYLKLKRAKISLPEELNWKIKESAGRIYRGKPAFEELFSLVKEARGETLCQIHKKVDSDVPDSCNLCFENAE